MPNLSDILTAAINDFEQHGFDSEDRLNEWLEKLRQAIGMNGPIHRKLDAKFREQLRAIFERLVSNERILANHSGVPRFTLRSMAPRLHSELDRRIMANASLIRFNRTEAVNKTLQRFSGWASSVPKGGTSQIDRRQLKAEISKPIQQLPFVERRVLIDQGHKLNASISAVIANDGGAIAGKWFSHFRQSGYDYREDHRERDGHIFLIRGSWAHKDGLIKPSPYGYMEDIDQPAEKPFCRCKWIYLYHLRQLSEEMLTAKGKASLEKAKSL